MDTTTKAVQQLADDIGKGRISRANTAAATLRALAQERDALAADCIVRVAEENAARHVAETERDAARAEVERLRAAWLFVIQAENACVATGAPCRGGGKCGCAAELEMLLREHDERAALAATEDKQ